MNQILVVLSAAFWCVAANAHNKPEKFSLDAALKAADAVVLAKVVDVQYAFSKGDGRQLETLPHTFVTFEISRVLKGNPNQARVTLRFLGGRGKESQFMMVNNAPLFDPGQDDILFIKGNQTVSCPLVSCAEGRMRLIKDMSYSDVGQQLVQTPKRQLAFGKFEPLEEVLSHHVSQTTIFRRIVNEQGEGKPEDELPIGDHLRAAALIEFIMARVQALDPNHKWDRLPAIKSASIEKTFTVRLPKAVAKKVPAQTGFMRPEPTAAELEEEIAFKRNGGNPVLK